MKYIPIIGLEIHVQLKTASKMFCACSTGYGAGPNTHVCPVCLGYPGSLPVMNREAVRMTVQTGVMIGCRINRYSKFDRKSYFYPDMPKNYQITQYDKPLCLGGGVTIQTGGTPRTVAITRIHLEEDVGKSMHFSSNSGVDFNRAGTPLMEIVTEPDIHSPEEAFDFLVALKQILEYAGVSRCNLEEGNIRCDVNCSVRPEGQAQLGVKTELKNLNTFKGVFHALKHEIPRQVEVLESGGRIHQETRRWDMDTGMTYSMRSKEEAHDYRYFPEPDLMPVVLSDELIEQWGSSLPERPDTRRERFVQAFGLPVYDAGVLTAEKDVADYFEAAARNSSNVKALSNWLMTEMLRLLAERGMSILEVPVTPAALAALVGLVDAKTINMPTARAIFSVLFEKGGDPVQMVKESGLTQVSDAGALEQFVEKAITDNPKSVADFKAGKRAALQFLVGNVMKMSKGKANPQVVGRMIEERLLTPSGT